MPLPEDVEPVPMPLPTKAMASVLGVGRTKTSTTWKFFCARLDSIAEWAYETNNQWLLNQILADCQKRVEERRQQHFEREQLPQLQAMKTGTANR